MDWHIVYRTGISRRCCLRKELKDRQPDFVNYYLLRVERSAVIIGYRSLVQFVQFLIS